MSMRACTFKAYFTAAAAMLLLAAGTGCHGINIARRGCDECGRHGRPGAGHEGGLVGKHGPHGAQGVPHHFTREYYGPQGPSTGAVAYPYYTTRGPRDFLVDNPPSIGR